jgi:very-short-patch-repair endonuclease
LGDGRLKPLHHGVYLVGAVPPQFAYPQAALFACGADSALGCRSALSIWRLLSYPPQAHPWVTVPPERRIVRRGIVVVRAPLPEQDVRRKHGMRVVSPPRAVLDFAANTQDSYELESLVAEAHFRRLARESELRDQIARNAGRPGVGPLRRVLDIEGGPQRTRSKGERWFLRLLRESHINGFEVNAEIFGWEVDFLWRELGFCIELDGWDGHSSRKAFEKDRRKWANLSRNGLTVMPLATRSAQRNKEETIRLVTEMLRQSSARRAT